MTLTLPNTENVQLDIILPRVKIKSRNDIISYAARQLAHKIFYTADELTEPLSGALQGSTMSDGIAVPCIILPRLTRPFTALITFDEPVDLGAADAGHISMMMLLIMPQKDGALNQIRLARVSRLFKNTDLSAHIIDAHSENEIVAALLSADRQQIAA